MASCAQYCHSSAVTLHLANPLRLRVYPSDWYHDIILQQDASSYSSCQLNIMPSGLRGKLIRQLDQQKATRPGDIRRCKLILSEQPVGEPGSIEHAYLRKRKKKSSARSWNHRANLMKTCVSKVLGEKQEASCNHLATPGFQKTQHSFFQSNKCPLENLMEALVPRTRASGKG